ncbi:MAG: DUF3616 domain-containing protein [Verrucomicrobiia bacterium]
MNDEFLMSVLRQKRLFKGFLEGAIIIPFLNIVAYSAVYINEVLFNPPGTDTPNEYLELRGTPNYILPEGTYFLGIEGDANGNPGVIQNIFDLSNVRIGGNGFLVLLQKGSPYINSIAAGTTVLINTGSGPGWGSGSTSSIKHQGEGGQTEIENPSVTFMLINATSKPSIGMDIDANNDGLPDPDIFTNWIVLDSIGILDSSGAGDISYGMINFRANPDATARLGRVLELNFVPSYIGRLGNTTNYSENDWVVSDNLGGAAPIWILGPPGSTLPSGYAMAPLNHIGSPNFDAFLIPGVIINQPSNPVISENGGTFDYSIRLNTQPSGFVTIRITTDGQTLVSADGGVTFNNSSSVTFSNTNSAIITVKAVNDNIVETAVHNSVITHKITQTYDNQNYPAETIIPDVIANITDNDFILLNEIKVNPPGEDSPYEFVEIIGPPGALLTNVYFLVIDGNGDKNPGKVDFIYDLSGKTIGNNGLLFLCASNSHYQPSPETSVYYVPDFSNQGGQLLNGAASFMLLSTTNPPAKGRDLDDNNDGILEDLEKDTFVYDAIGWTNGKTNDIVYGGVKLNLPQGVPDAATRIPQNLIRLSSNAWFYGQLAGNLGVSIEYDESRSSQNLPYGANLTPGKLNNDALIISKIEPFSGVVGDPTNPEVYFTISNAISPPQYLILTVTNTNPYIASQTNIYVTNVSGYKFKLKIEPIGAGYSTIVISVFDGIRQGTRSVLYAASLMGRSGGIFLTGASDASAAIAINDEWMFVGDDENETIRLYPRKWSGAPVAEFNMTPYLGLTDFEGERPREVDIEGAFRIRNKIYWIGSHSNANLAEGRTNRARIFVTEIIGEGTNSTLTYIGRYDYLKADLVNWDLNNGHGKGSGYYDLAYSTQDGVNPKTPWGFNIEGIAPAPMYGPAAAFVGFRAPIVPPTNRVHTLIIPVLNFTNIAESGAPEASAVFGPPIEIDLFGRGIRDIAGDSNGYIIIAGTPKNFPGDYPDDFKIYTWSGLPDDPPQERSADLTGLIPEGIVELPPHPWTEETEIQLVSDCGTRDYYGDGTPAKLLPYPGFKKFRVDTVKLGSVVKPAPIIKDVSKINGGVKIVWRSVRGNNYRVQFKGVENYSNGWLNASGTIQASSEWTSFIDAAITNQNGKIYRIVVEP